MSGGTALRMIALLDSMRGVAHGFTTIGPRGGDPYELFDASCELNSQSLAQLDLLFSLGRMADIERLTAPMKETLAEYQHANAPQETTLD